jgi:integrase
LAALRRIESRGAIETAHRARQNCGQVFRYGIATGRCNRDVAADLKGALQPTVTKHHASIIDPIQIGGLLRAIDSYQGMFVSRSALKLAPLVFLRPVELRQAEWSEFNLDAREWRIPPTKMKMKEMHIVPLSKQAMEILVEIRPLTGTGRYVFPSVRSGDRPMSENTVLAALRRMGYGTGEMTGHGFRSMASTLMNEGGWGIATRLNDNSRTQSATILGRRITTLSFSRNDGR